MHGYITCGMQSFLAKAQHYGFTQERIGIYPYTGSYTGERDIEFFDLLKSDFDSLFGLTRTADQQVKNVAYFFLFENLC